MRPGSTASAACEEVQKLFEHTAVVLAKRGMGVALEHAALLQALSHVADSGDDIVCMPFSGPHGHLFKVGVRVPAGQNLHNPDIAEFYSSIELPQIGTPPYSDGLRLSKRTGRASWHANFWSINPAGADLGGIRREIFKEINLGVPMLILKADMVTDAFGRMAELYMTGC